ncbi:MAG: nucleotidyl transferase AbiEii/AbiGii toxin family protein [Saprospiraceae bacterium]|nr:nucleotidyl transferase AbiEii/AbiGii toxin family protein [Saprospiraceae bacterium]MBX7179672.1 nucleotidyl transferase AbiEii/AbiGii toxin family protein [Saprospiraceae bacterium]MCB0589916.1 nucleotidyl transferase AbiEii/AbiGii toxin family protein [Saprospiraceae bacterium]MCO6471347.1 nucleotidyl transferase AbiEii/AbiGii toxin family protein [Saprospiraceae bacterium]HMY83399.1 nucleotidyl transferase AbiEii/AbiGii toxin family protein [Saprospiraceae bacterium]
MLQTQTVEPGTLDLLKKCMELDALQPFTLVGGTALSLQYGHRMSIDLDFFGNVNFLDDKLISEQFASIGNAELVNQSSVMLGFFINEIKVDIVKYKYDFIEKPITEGIIRLAHPKDIGAMKLAAISGRGKRKDFYDLYYLLRDYSLEDLISFNKKKFPDSNEMIIIKSLGYFDDADLDQQPILMEQVSWSTVKKTISGHLQNYIRKK